MVLQLCLTEGFRNRGDLTKHIFPSLNNLILIKESQNQNQVANLEIKPVVPDQPLIPKQDRKVETGVKHMKIIYLEIAIDGLSLVFLFCSWLLLELLLQCIQRKVDIFRPPRIQICSRVARLFRLTFRDFTDMIYGPSLNLWYIKYTERFNRKHAEIVPS